MSYDTNNITISVDQFRWLLHNVSESKRNQVEGMLFTHKPLVISEPATFAHCMLRFDGTTDVELFLMKIEIYKECTAMSNETALNGLPLLFTGFAASWWRTMARIIATWNDAKGMLRQMFKKQESAMQMSFEFFNHQQDEKIRTAVFVDEKRALLAKLLQFPSSEENEINLIYELLNQRIRTHVTRSACTTFAELVKQAEEVEFLFYNVVPPQLAKQGGNNQSPGRPGDADEKNHNDYSILGSDKEKQPVDCKLCFKFSDNL